nr:hypothetical protein [Tanacetum cinerariifolium]
IPSSPTQRSYGLVESCITIHPSSTTIFKDTTTPFLLLYTGHRDDIPKVDMPLRKRARSSALVFGFEVKESLAAAAKQVGHALTISVDYRFIDTMDASIRASKSRAMIAVGLTSHIQHEHDKFRELVRTQDTGHQDGPADAGSSC